MVLVSGRLHNIHLNLLSSNNLHKHSPISEERDGRRQITAPRRKSGVCVSVCVCLCVADVELNAPEARSRSKKSELHVVVKCR